MDKLKFCIQAGESTPEKLAIVNGSHELGYEYVFSNIKLENHIPIGTVDYCDPHLDGEVKNFYPEFLKSYLNRNVFHAKIDYEGYDRPYFIKDALNWKSDFQSMVYPVGMPIGPGHFWFSDIVNFYMEFRLYIAAGNLIGTGTYTESYELLDTNIHIKWPKNFSGAVDFGYATGFDKPLLIEAHPPFACGLYEISDEDYTFWQYEAWLNYIENKNE